MRKEKKLPTTELKDRDKKVLDKYAGFYTNFIESNTAKTEINEEDRFKGRVH